MMRAGMAEAWRQDFALAARAKGLSRRRIVVRHIARNALLPTVSALAISLGAVLGGSLVTEVVFNYPGMGNTLYQAIREAAARHVDVRLLEPEGDVARPLVRR